MNPRASSGVPKALLFGGLAAFALGAALALSILPEWRRLPSAEPAAFERAFADLARGFGLVPAPGRPKVGLAIDSADLYRSYQDQGERAASALIANRSAVGVSVSQRIARPALGAEPTLRVRLALDGQPLRVQFSDSRLDFFRAANPRRYEQLLDRFEEVLVRPGESVVPPFQGQKGVLARSSARLIVPSEPPLRLEVQFLPPLQIQAGRTLATHGPGPESGNRLLLGTLVELARVIVVLLVVFGAFFALLARKSLDVWNAALLAALVLATTNPSWILEIPGSVGSALVTLVFKAAGLALWVLVTWSAGESLLRVSHPGFTTSLDNLRRARLGPRGGRALLAGLGCGAGLAGLKLTVASLAVVLPGISPAGTSLEVPLFRGNGSAVADGIVLAAHAVLVLGLAVRFLPPRWVYPATAVAMGAAFETLPLHPGWAGFGAGALVAVVLAWAGRRLGLTTLLVSAMVSFLLPAALFAGRYILWMPGAFAVCATALLALAVLGFAGTFRPEDRETEPLPQPAFMRRLEEEQRVRYEVGLLARMQAGLMPREMPRLPGYEIVARSILAGDAGGDLYDFLRDAGGGLWIAAGDVAGNGYPCAVAQAMIKATLLSVIAPDESPDRVLSQTDRVLRRAHLPRRFSTLALLRLEPASGEIVLSNAGHPFPLLVADRQLSEIELPGLPLGRGPERVYGLRRFTLPPGGLLVVYSDGLAETLDRAGRPYGFGRVREVVEAMANRPAHEVVDALLNDGRRHLEGEAAQDDITVVAIRRI